MYLWGFANNTVSHPMLHPFVSIIKQSLSGGNLVTKFFRVFTNLISSWLKYFCPLLPTLLNRGLAILLRFFMKGLA